MEPSTLRRRLMGGGGGNSEAEEPLLDHQGQILDGTTGRRLRLRGGDTKNCCMCVAYCFLLWLLTSLIGTLEPNEYGLVQNYISGNVSYEVQRGGVHLLGPTQGFIKFPATQLTLEFSAKSRDRPAVMTRTGADKAKKGDTGNDGDVERHSGGQPIEISCAVQYTFDPSSLLNVYLLFGTYEVAKERFLLWVGNMVSNSAQDFTPQDFWENRDAIARRMLADIDRVLFAEGFVHATQFEIIAVDFPSRFEDSITQVQVAEQTKVINQYDQQVQGVEQAIEVLKSHNDAIISNISAAADAEAKEMCAKAKREAFAVKQTTKARKYAELQKRLELDDVQMTEYLKIKALQFQESSTGGQLVVGLPSLAQ